jgi:hypothetical protein
MASPLKKTLVAGCVSLLLAQSHSAWAFLGFNDDSYYSDGGPSYGYYADDDNSWGGDGYRSHNYRSNYGSRSDYSSHRHYRYSDSDDNGSWGRGSGSFFRGSAASHGPANGRGTVVVDLNRLQWAAYNPSGELVRTGRASGGRSYCPDIHRGCRSPVGRFTVYSKGGSDCISRKFPVGRGGAKMPYCMFFHGGYALHGSYEVPDYNASHGCVRTPPESAAWLSHNFVRVGTVVVVKPY